MQSAQNQAIYWPILEKIIFKNGKYLAVHGVRLSIEVSILRHYSSQDVHPTKPDAEGALK
jgi:hypothetical protein